MGEERKDECRLRRVLKATLRHSALLSRQQEAIKACRVHGAADRQVATGPTAVRLGNSPNLSESWFHHLYTGLVGINVSLQNRAQPTSSPSPMTSHIPHSESQSQHEVHQPCMVCPCLDITPTYSKCSRLGAGPWSSLRLKCYSRHRCNSLSGFFHRHWGTYLFVHLLASSAGG